MTTIGSPPAGPPDHGTRGALNLFAILTSLTAFFVATLGIVAVATLDRSASGTAATAGPVTVSLSEFKIAPATVNAPAGTVKLQVTNSGSLTHNLSIPSLGKKTADLEGGRSTTFDLGDIPAGSYEFVCEVPGHADSGMKGTLVVGGSGSGTAAAAGTDSAAMDHGSTDYAALDKKMMDGMAASLKTFTGGNATKGVGNQKLAPVVEADGTKVFTLEPAIIDWEVAPGKTVKAWAYNGMVPGPWIRTEPGDKVKIVVNNKLPVGTDVHYHGITTPFEDDGLAPLTQDVIAAGASYTYEWTNVNHSELGMYHAHMHGDLGIPNGLFAVFQVGDMALPTGRTINHVTIPANLKPTYEMPMVLNDAGVIGLSLNGKSFPATAPVSMNPGESLLLHYYNEGLAAHPMHLHHVPQLVVAKDGFPLAEPYLVDTLNVAPGERYSVLVLPSAEDVGVWAWHCHILNHAENSSGLFGMVTALIVNDPTKAK